MKISRSNSHAVGKLLLGGGFHGIHALGRRREVLGHALDHVAGELEVGIAQRVLARQVAHQRQRGRTSATRLARPGLLGQASGDAAILSNSFWPGSMASISLLTGSPLTIMFSAGFHAQHARQALRAARAGDQAQLDFGQAMLQPGAAMR
jgi:hypothetical protein